MTHAAEPTRRSIRRTSPILLLSVHSDTMPLIQVDEYANIFLAQQISQVPGVAQVSVFGDRTPSIRVQVDPAKLAASGLTLEDIRGTLVSVDHQCRQGRRSTPTRSASRSPPTTRSPMPSKFNDVVLAYRNGAPIRVRDVGQAVADAGRPHRRRLSEQPATASSSRCSSSPAPTSSTPSTRSRRSCRSSPRAFRRRSRSRPFSTAPSTIRASVADVEFTLALTICLVVMVILLFLRNFWATLIPERHRAAGARRLVRGDVSAAISASTTCR